MPFYIQTPPLTPAQHLSSTSTVTSPTSQNNHLLAEDEEQIDVVHEEEEEDMEEMKMEIEMQSKSLHQKPSGLRRSFRPLIASELRSGGIHKTSSDSNLKRLAGPSSSDSAGTSGYGYLPRPASNLPAGINHEFKIDPLQTVQQFLQMHQSLMNSPSVPTCLSKLLIDVSCFSYSVLLISFTAHTCFLHKYLSIFAFSVLKNQHFFGYFFQNIS